MMTRLLGVIACLGLLAGCGGFSGGFGGPVQGSPPASGALTEIDESSGENFSAGYLNKADMPIQMNKQVKNYLVYFSTERKAVVNRWLARSTRYLPMIKETFREYGLPEDLAYLAMIESGFNPDAGSPAGAVGMWQFIKGTGLRYGLVINGSVDERRDPVKSTHAAARYLTDLYKQFGSWYLATASYNCGEGRVQKELRKANHRNFWELSDNRCLPTETKNYVPQLIAATIIAKNPERFGFTKVPYQEPLASEFQVARGSRATAPVLAGSLGGASGSVKAFTKTHAHAAPQPKKKGRNRTALAQQSERRYQTGAGTPRNPAQAAHSVKGRGDDAPHTASLFGRSPAPPPQGWARKPKPTRKGAYANKPPSPSKSGGKGKKSKPVLAAMKGKAKSVQAKNGRTKTSQAKNRKPAKTRRQALLAQAG